MRYFKEEMKSKTKVELRKESVLQRLYRGLRFGVDVEFLVNILQVGANRVGTDEQSLANGLVTQTLHHKLQNLFLARRKLLGLLSRNFSVKNVQNFAGNPGRHRRTAVVDFADRFQNPGGRCLFQ